MHQQCFGQSQKQRSRVAASSIAPPPSAITSSSPRGELQNRCALPPGETPFAFTAEKSRESSRPPRRNHVVHVDEAPAQPLGHQRPDSRLSRAHESGEHDAPRGTCVSARCQTLRDFFRRFHSFQYRDSSLLCSVVTSFPWSLSYPNTITIAPAVISTPPITAATFSFSPSSSHANTITSGTLSLSSGATREAGPSCSARK